MTVEGTLAPPITRKSNNREVLEPSVSSIQVRSLPLDVPLEVIQQEIFGRKEEEFEEERASPSRPPSSRPEAVEREEVWRGYTDEEIDFVRGAVAEGVTHIGGIVEYSRSHCLFITGNVIGNMCSDGHFGRDGEEIFLLDDDDDAG